MVELPKRVRAERRNETRELTRPIEVALNKLPGVWCARNTVGSGYHRNGDPATWGLGTGSADLIGCVHGHFKNGPTRPVPNDYELLQHTLCIARFFALEIKWPGKRLNADQVGWHKAIRARVPGVFLAVAHSVEEAVAAVERCRRGEAV